MVSIMSLNFKLLMKISDIIIYFMLQKYVIKNIINKIIKKISRVNEMTSSWKLVSSNSWERHK